MQSVDKIVREGYQILAAETEVALEHLRTHMEGKQPTVTKATLRRFGRILTQVQQTGDIASLGGAVKGNLDAVVAMLDTALPAPLRPDNPMSVLGLATTAIRAYHDIPDFQTMLQQGRIRDVQMGGTQGGIAHMILSDGTREKVLLVEFNPSAPSFSVIGNIHNLSYCFMPEQENIFEELEKVDAIPHYSDVAEVINSDARLQRQMVQASMKSHIFRFLKTARIVKIAREKGVDVDAYTTILDQGVPTLDFLTCYTSGTAYVYQADIIRGAPDLQERPAEQAVYHLLALTDALGSAFRKPKQKVYRVGVGMVAFMRANPDQAEEIKNSRAFHEELSRTYFDS